MYSGPMKRRTNIILDRELVDEAATFLGTDTATETVHAALREVIALERRRSLARRDFPGLTLARVRAMRRARTS